MATSGSAHRITLEPATRRWRAHFSHHVIADTNDALILREAGLPPVVYFPRADVAMEYMGRTERHTRCPFKGDASYYTLTMDGEIAENVAWSYEDPFEAMESIARRIAFYPDRVDVYDVDDAAVNPRHHEPMVARSEIEEVIRHTDAGDGTSQAPRWDPDAEVPSVGDGGMR
jgi:uncharacterized protein (DUF427 family)